MGVKEDKVKNAILKRFGGVLRIWTNPVGVAVHYSKTGRRYTVDYGLSKGSHDLILEIPRLIQAKDVGTVIGQFGSCEVKRFGALNEIRPDQIIFGDVVQRFGGLPIYAESVEDVEIALADIVIAKV